MQKCTDQIHMLIEILQKISVLSSMGHLKEKSATMIYEQWNNLEWNASTRTTAKGNGGLARLKITVVGSTESMNPTMRNLIEECQKKQLRGRLANTLIGHFLADGSGCRSCIEKYKWKKLDLTRPYNEIVNTDTNLNY